MTKRRRASGQFELPVPAAEAIGYFTPEGERDWAPGWDPVYPEGTPSESPGTVFTTSHSDQDTVWTIYHIDRNGFTAAYSRHNIGNWAGTAKVRCEDQDTDSCVVTVEYDTTILPGGDPSILNHFDGPSYEAMMNEWAARVTATI